MVKFSERISEFSLPLRLGLWLFARKSESSNRESDKASASSGQNRVVRVVEIASGHSDDAEDRRTSDPNQSVSHRIEAIYCEVNIRAST